MRIIYILYVCDGSLKQRKNIKIIIPKAILQNNNISDIDINRGEFLYIKRAKIVAEDLIVCELYSEIKIMR